MNILKLLGGYCIEHFELVMFVSSGYFFKGFGISLLFRQRHSKIHTVSFNYSSLQFRETIHFLPRATFVENRSNRSSGAGDKYSEIFVLVLGVICTLLSEVERQSWILASFSLRFYRPRLLGPLKRKN